MYTTLRYRAADNNRELDGSFHQPHELNAYVLTISASNLQDSSAHQKVDKQQQHLFAYEVHSLLAYSRIVILSLPYNNALAFLDTKSSIAHRCNSIPNTLNHTIQ